MKTRKVLGLMLCALLIVGAMAGCGQQGAFGVGQKKEAKEFLNVSYDPTRELYAEFNEEFTKIWEKQSGKTMLFTQSNGGSGKQARAVIEKMEADVVTLALSYDVDEIAQAGLIRKDWQAKFPDNSAPYTSTIVFLVRKGNPKNIQDWGDLERDGVKIVTPNPKTSGGARWSYLAAWEFAHRKLGGNEEDVKEFLRKMYRNVVVLDVGARGSTNSFVRQGQGDVLITWENEALLVCKQSPDYEIVIPSVSILAEPPVAVVDAVVDEKGTREVAEAYIDYLYAPGGQEIAARNFYRPRNKEILEKYQSQFPKLSLFTIDEAFGGWAKAHKKHFSDGGTFDQIRQKY